jgi:hypothetical protein
VKVEGSMPGKSLRARGRSSSMKGTMMKTEKGTRRNRSDTVRTSCLQPIRGWFILITYRVAYLDPDPYQDQHYFRKLDPDPHPDPHYFWKLDPDPHPDPHYFGKLDPDPHKSDKLYRIRIRIEDKI